jgi:hypothetical protein
VGDISPLSNSLPRIAPALRHSASPVIAFGVIAAADLAAGNASKWLFRLPGSRFMPVISFGVIETGNNPPCLDKRYAAHAAVLSFFLFPWVRVKGKKKKIIFIYKY